MSWSRTTLVADGSRNASVHVVGAYWDPLPLCVFDAQKHFKEAKRIKIESLVWLLQEKLTLLLYWSHPDENDFMLPMESRNYVRFDRGLESPKTWNGELWVKPENIKRSEEDTLDKHFMFILDLDKL